MVRKARAPAQLGPCVDQPRGPSQEPAVCTTQGRDKTSKLTVQQVSLEGGWSSVRLGLAAVAGWFRPLLPSTSFTSLSPSSE